MCRAARSPSTPCGAVHSPSMPRGATLASCRVSPVPSLRSWRTRSAPNSTTGRAGAQGLDDWTGGCRVQALHVQGIKMPNHVRRMITPRATAPPFRRTLIRACVLSLRELSGPHPSSSSRQRCRRRRRGTRRRRRRRRRRPLRRGAWLGSAGHMLHVHVV